MKIYTILGDFNISALDYETFQLLKTIQNSDELIVKKPTHLDGGGGLYVIMCIYAKCFQERKELMLFCDLLCLFAKLYISLRHILYLF